MSKENRVLADHKKVGSVLQTPFSELNIQLGNWSKGALPELLWIGLVLKKFGEKDGVELITRLAQISEKHVFRKGPFCFAMTSAYSFIPFECRQTVVEEFSREGDLNGLRDALNPLIYFYPECPLAFLYTDLIANEKEPKEALNTFKTFVASLFDKYSRLPVFMKATLQYVLRVSGRLRVQADAEYNPDLNSLSQFPDTEDSRMAAALVNSMCGAFMALVPDDIGVAWQQYFWRRGFEIDTCHVEVPHNL